MLNKIAFKVALAGLIASLSGAVSALDNQWYLGIGGGISQLQPDAEDTAIGLGEKHGQVATVFIGRDFDNRSSGQFQLYSLGETEYSDGQSTASYTAGDASLLYRFYDSRDRQPRVAISGTSFYGRLGIGFMQRNSDLSLDTDTPGYFAAGAGMESYLSYNLAIRLEALFHDTDASSATLTLVSRFGGRRRLPEALPPVPHKPAMPTESKTTDTAEPLETENSADTSVTSITVQESAVAVPIDLPETYEISPAEIPAIDARPDTSDDFLSIPDAIADAEAPHSPITTADSGNNEIPDVAMKGIANAGDLTDVELPGDTDADGVLNDRDLCPESAAGYPVTARGCPAFGGMLPDLIFNDRTADLSSSSYAALDELVQQLNEFPTTYIELVAHTDNSGSEAEQSKLTRQRLRNIGAYLVRHGINQDRLLLRSYGGSRPVYDSSTTEGRRRNNRIEVFENP